MAFRAEVEHPVHNAHHRVDRVRHAHHGRGVLGEALHGVACAGGVEGEQGLVAKQKLRVLRECLRLADQLLLAAGEYPHAPLGKGLRPHRSQLPIDVLRSRPPSHRQRNKVAPAHRQVFREHVLLRDESDLAMGVRSSGTELARAHQRAKQGGFAHAVWAEHRDEFAGLDGEGEVAPEWFDGGAAKLSDQIGYS